MDMLMINRKKLVSNEQGFASIVIALTLIIVLSLLTIGFANLARREQKNALDKQLAVQANYAAETGINDAIKDIQTGAIYDNTATGGGTDASTTTCMSTSPPAPLSPLPSGALTANPMIDSVKAILYSCLLVDLKPSDLVYSNVGANDGRYTTFYTDQLVKDFTVHWGSYENRTTWVPTGTGFKPLSDWSTGGATPSPYPPVLQVSLTPLRFLDRSNLLKNTFSIYLYPSAGTTNHTLAYTTSNGANEGKIAEGGCDATIQTYPCSVTIQIPGIFATGPYLIRMVDYYDNSNIRITGTARVAGNPPIKFLDAQAQIDVTGKAKSDVKRLQVRTPIRSSYGLPNNAIEGEACKRFQTDPLTGTSPQLPPGYSGAACNLN